MNTLIITGGNIDIKFLKEHVEKTNYDNIIAVDKGLEAVYNLSLSPNHIVGDLDSVNCSILEKYSNNSNITLHKYIPEKDYTDTDIALKLAIKLKSTYIAIIGATGTRFDHTLANVHVLCYALENNICCEIIDANNKIYLINTKTELNKNSVYGKFISLIPLTTCVTKLSLTGFKYPLKDYTLKIGISLGISNEIIDNIAIINLKDGILIVVESKD